MRDQSHQAETRDAAICRRLKTFAFADSPIAGSHTLMIVQLVYSLTANR
jgi:hypothetical protein